jgi:hypothetical protein
MGCCCSHFLSPSRTFCPSQTSQVQNPILEIMKFYRICSTKELKLYKSRSAVIIQIRELKLQLIYDNLGPHHIYVATSAMFMPTG